MDVVRILTEFWDDPDNVTLAGYEKHGVYQAIRKVLAIDPDEVIDTPAIIEVVIRIISSGLFSSRITSRTSV